MAEYACYLHGNLVYLVGDEWVYEDGGAVDHDHPRPCPRCGRPPTPEGYDACLGRIDGCFSACCGHGVTEEVRM